MLQAGFQTDKKDGAREQTGHISQRGAAAEILCAWQWGIHRAANLTDAVLWRETPGELIPTFAGPLFGGSSVARAPAGVLHDNQTCFPGNRFNRQNGPPILRQADRDMRRHLRRYVLRPRGLIFQVDNIGGNPTATDGVVPALQIACNHHRVTVADPKLRVGGDDRNGTAGATRGTGNGGQHEFVPNAAIRVIIAGLWTGKTQHP